MKRGQIIEGYVDHVDFPNKGKVHIPDEEGGFDIAVKNVIEGQKISLSVKKARRNKAEGRLLEILEPSPLENEKAFCGHYGICGGCSYQTLDYEKQLAIKEQQVKSLLAPVLKKAEIEEVFEGIKCSPKQFGYRNKMEFSFGDAYKDGPLSLGMHKKGSFYDIVEVSQCQIVHEDFCKILTATLDFFTNVGADFYHKMSHKGYLRHLLVRRGEKTGEILVDLVTSSDVSFNISVVEQDMLADYVLALTELQLEGTFAGILHTRNDREADVVENQGTEILYGQDFFYEELLGLRFKISPFSFFQTNSLGAEVLYDTARRFIAEGTHKDAVGKTGNTLEGKVLYDLYSGTGTIAQILAPVAKHVIGVEIVEEAVEAAKENAKLNHLDNCDFLAGDVLKVLDDIKEKPDYIILDPPRDGIHPKALQKIIDYGVDSMLYISCKSTSLARDLVVLQEEGYEVKRVCCVDLFPGTVHVECVVLMSKVQK